MVAHSSRSIHNRVFDELFEKLNKYLGLLISSVSLPHVSKIPNITMIDKVFKEKKHDILCKIFKQENLSDL